MANPKATIHESVSPRNNFFSSYYFKTALAFIRANLYFFSISTIDQLEVKNERFNWKKDENNNIVILSKHTEIIKNPFDSVYRVTLTK